MAHRTPIATISLAVVLSLGGTPVAAQAPSVWAELVPGPHAVGFQSETAFDYARAYASAEARPIQILIWYPATSRVRSSPMQFQDYLDLSVTKESADAPSQERVLENRSAWSRTFARRGADENKVLTASMLATRDAQPATGRFPLIVYAAGAEGEAFENAVLAEYLASHGYVVLASPSVGVRGQRMLTNSVHGGEEQARDMEFLISRARDLTTVSRQSLALIGYSWGALAAALVQMRNPNVDAVLSLDGTLPEHEATAGASVWYDPSLARVPYMFMVAEDDTMATPSRFFEPLRYAAVHYLGFSSFQHGDFTALYGFVAAVVDPEVARSDARRRGYETICRNALHFLDANLKDDPTSRDALAHLQPRTVSGSQTVVYWKREALPAPPSQQAFFDLIRTEGISAARDVYESVKATDPGYVLFREMDLVELAFELFNRHGRKAEAIATMQLGVDDRLFSWRSRGFLGELHRKNDDSVQALADFSIAYGMALRASQASQGAAPAELVESLAWYNKEVERLREELHSKR